MHYSKQLIAIILLSSVSHSSINTENKLDRNIIKNIILKSSKKIGSNRKYVPIKKKVTKRKKVVKKMEENSSNNTRVITHKKELEFGRLPQLPPTLLSIEHVKKKAENKKKIKKKHDIFEELSDKKSDIEKYF